MPSPIPGPPPFATGTLSGLVSTTTQSFGGNKTFLGKIQMSGNALGLESFTTAGRPAAAANTGALIYNTDVQRIQYSDGAAWFSLDASVGSFVLKAGDTMTGALTITGAGLVVDSADNTLVVDDVNNRVGILNAAPTVTLDVGGSVKVAGTLDLFTALGNTKLYLFNDGSNTRGIGYQANDFRFHLNSSTDKFSFRVSPAGASLMELAGTGNLTVDGGDNTFIVDAVNNRVGVGTLTPGFPLSVNGVIQSASGGFRFPDASVQTSAFVPSSYVAKVGDTMSGQLNILGAGLNVDSADNTFFVDATNNRVAIGHNAPTRAFDIRTSTTDHLVEIKNTNVAGSSGIAFVDNANVERLRVGYANPSFAGTPLANLNFLQTDSSIDLIIAHAGTLAHRFFTNSNVKFDQVDNTLFIDAVNNRIGIGQGTPASGFLIDALANIGSNGKVLKIQNDSSAGHSAISFYHPISGTFGGSIGIGGGTVTDGGQGIFSIDINAGFTLRSGTTNYHNFTNSGAATFGVASNTLVVGTVNQVGVCGIPSSGVAGFVHPLTVTAVTGADRTVLITGVGTQRKGLSIHDSTNTRTWTWDHSTSANNNRMELFYHNGTTESRILVATTTGRLGVGNITPVVELDVVGSGQFTGSLTVDTDSLIVDAAQSSVGIGTTPGAGNKLDVTGKVNITGDLVVDSTTLTVDSTNNRVGVGNAAPTVPLDVTGAAKISADLTVDTTTFHVDSTNNRVGIGTTTPSVPLDVVGQARSSAVAVTAATGTGITTNYNGDFRRGFFKITFTEAAFTAAAVTEDLTVCTIPAKARVVSVVADTTTAFTGGGATTATLRLGKTTNGQEYLLDHSVFATGTKGLVDGDLGTSINRANAVQGGDIPSWTATTDLKIRLTSDVNVADLTAGSVTFYITVEFL